MLCLRTILAAFFVPATAVATPQMSQDVISPFVGATVHLDYGTFIGFENTSAGIVQFQGVRYAEAPLGDLRWRAPISPPRSQLGLVNATQFADACVQTSQSKITPGYSEDCLFGNIYLPNTTKVDDALPVLVWFHGGGYQGGSTHDASPDFIFKSSHQPFVFASFEYRLGQFGFLGGSLIKANGTLNAGLQDQRAALRWVQQYIHFFGGDKLKVTIWGQSAGAGSVMFHLLANGGDNQGLFRQAIAHSPPLAFTPSYDEPYDEEVFMTFASLAGCLPPSSATTTQAVSARPTGPTVMPSLSRSSTTLPVSASTPTPTHDSILACLRSINSTALIQAGSKLRSSRPSTLYIFAPVLDGDFVSTRPVEAFTSNSRPFSKVPLLTGSNTNEGSKWSARLSDPLANTSTPGADEGTVFSFLKGQYNSLTRDVIQDATSGAQNLYPLQEVYNGNVSLQAQQMYGELRYICTAFLMANAMARAGNKAVWHYHYDNPHLGSDHQSELAAFFSPESLPSASPGDLALFEIMRQYWTSFVTTGVPQTNADSGLTWNTSRCWLTIIQAVSDQTGNPRVLLSPGGVVLENADDALRRRCDFWHSNSDVLET